MYDFTRATLHQAVAALAFLALTTAPAMAQTYRSALGVTGGWSVPGDVTPGLGSETVPDPGWTLGVQQERWWGSRRVATRLNAGYAERTVADAPEQYQLVSADAGLVFRVLSASRDRAVAPFLGVGAGAVAYRGKFGSQPMGGGMYGPEPVVRALVQGSMGADFFTGSPVGLRVEAVDHVVLPSIGYSPASGGVPTVHNLEVRSALQLRFGRAAAPAVVAMAVTPAPPVAVRSEPESAVDGEVERLVERLEDQAREIGRLHARLEALEAAPRVASEPAPLGTPLARSVESAARVAAPGGALYTVQIGAFIEPGTARRWAGRLSSRSLPVWVAEHEIRGQTVNRVRVGALASRADADRLARRLAAEGWEVWVDRVEEGELIPGDAVPATERFLAMR